MTGGVHDMDLQKRYPKEGNRTLAQIRAIYANKAKKHGAEVSTPENEDKDARKEALTRRLKSNRKMGK
jgi:hypothetical protein